MLYKLTSVSNTKLNPLVLVNLLSGGTTGTTIDYSTGALWTYDDIIIVPVTPKSC